MSILTGVGRMNYQSLSPFGTYYGEEMNHKSAHIPLENFIWSMITKRVQEPRVEKKKQRPGSRNAWAYTEEIMNIEGACHYSPNLEIFSRR